MKKRRIIQRLCMLFAFMLLLVSFYESVAFAAENGVTWKTEYLKILTGIGSIRESSSYITGGVESVSFFDLTNDGIPELIFTHAEGFNQHFSIYSFSNGKSERVVYIDDFGDFNVSNDTYDVYLTRSGTLIARESNSGEFNAYTSYHIYEGIQFVRSIRIAHEHDEWYDWVGEDEDAMYFIDDVIVTKEQHDAEERRIDYSDVEYCLVKREQIKSVRSGATDLSMTYDEAIAYLNSLDVSVSSTVPSIAENATTPTESAEATLVTSDDSAIVDSAIVGSDSAVIATAVVTTIGVCIDWTPSGNAMGYRIYRFNSQGGTGVSISDLPIKGSSFFDVNVGSNKTYYYYIVAVTDEDTADSDSKSITLTPEEFEANGEIIALTTEDILELEGDEDGKEVRRGFIMMTIGNPYMIVNEDTMVEIDPPNRGTAPIVLNGRTMVPIRAIVESMGGVVDWDASAERITLEAQKHTVVMTLGSKAITADGAQKEMDIAPYLNDKDRTLLPVRFVAENLGTQIEWIASLERVVIVYAMEATE